MQEDQAEEVSSHCCSKQWSDSCNPPDPLDSYWEKLRMDGQFSRWQKPATD